MGSPGVSLLARQDAGRHANGPERVGRKLAKRTLLLRQELQCDGGHPRAVVIPRTVHRRGMGQVDSQNVTLQRAGAGLCQA